MRKINLKATLLGTILISGRMKSLESFQQISWIYKTMNKIINQKSICDLQNFVKLLKEWAFYYPLGGSINVGLLGENCHKISLIAGENPLLNECVSSLLWTLLSLPHWVTRSYISPLWLPKVGALLKAFLDPSYTATIISQSCAIFVLDGAYIWLVAFNNGLLNDGQG